MEPLLSQERERRSAGERGERERERERESTELVHVSSRPNEDAGVEKQTMPDGDEERRRYAKTLAQRQLATHTRVCVCLLESSLQILLLRDVEGGRFYVHSTTYTDGRPALHDNALFISIRGERTCLLPLPYAVLLHALLFRSLRRSHSMAVIRYRSCAV